MSEARPHCYAYPRPALTVDVVLVSWDGARVQVLLIQRGHQPFQGQWALPGGFVEIDEDLPDAARRELAEETGARNVHIEQLGAYGRLGRDPRGRTVSVVYLGLCRQAAVRVQSGDDAADARWFDWAQAPTLAFDHGPILSDARTRLADRVRSSPLARHLLPETFDPTALVQLHRHVLGCRCSQDDLIDTYRRRHWIETVGQDRYRFTAEP